MSILAVQEGTQEASADEELPYVINVANFTSSTPSAATAVAIDETTDETVTTTVFPTNSPSISTTYITLSPLKALTKGHIYRIEVLFTVGSAKYECYFKVKCTM